MEIFLSAKFVFAGFRLVRNSNQTPCFCTIWKDPLNDGNEDVVLVVWAARKAPSMMSTRTRIRRLVIVTHGQDYGGAGLNLGNGLDQ